MEGSRSVGQSDVWLGLSISRSVTMAFVGLMVSLWFGQSLRRLVSRSDGSLLA